MQTNEDEETIEEEGDAVFGGGNSSSPTRSVASTLVGMPREEGEAQSAAATLFSVLDDTMPGLVVRNTASHNKPTGRPYSSIANRLLAAGAKHSVPFCSLPISGELRHTVAHMWHGVLDAHRRALGAEESEDEVAYADSILFRVGGTDASLAAGVIPAPPKVISQMYDLHPDGLLGAFPTISDRLSKPKSVSIPFGHMRALMEDWRNSLRVLSFIDSVTGAVAHMAINSGHPPLLTLAAALGTAVGDLGKVSTHGYLSSLLIMRDHMLRHNKGVECLSHEVQTARLAPPLHSELLPGALIPEAELLAEKRRKSEQAAWTNMSKGLQTFAAKGPTGHQQQYSQSGAHPKSKRGRGGGKPQSRGGFKPYQRGQARGGAMPGRGRGAAPAAAPSFPPSRGARGGASRGKR